MKPHAFGSSSTTCSKGVDSTINCHHNIKSVLRVLKNGLNVGRKFHECSLWPVNMGCGFFLWKDDVEIRGTHHGEEMKTKADNVRFMTTAMVEQRAVQGQIAYLTKLLENEAKENKKFRQSVAFVFIAVVAFVGMLYMHFNTKKCIY
ncbi:unnamed protein product [Cuscuta europaea]|uniref:GRF-type domain-containing protein n=1 Tax=Cuscuta europaea TaxID=41803 RepID=A0A9P1DZB9_CUSEU|nr:unnamed protein product [Cuscuta europaea]